MTHQPYETWLFDTNELTREQKIDLNNHLNTCSRCNKLWRNWQEANTFIKRIPMASPSKGFTQRWQANLLAKKEMKRKAQVWQFFIYIAATAFISMAIMGFQILAAGMTSSILLNVFQQLALFYMQSIKLVTSLASWVAVIPYPVIFIICFALFSTGCVLCLVWVFSVLWVRQKGVLINEITA